ncbi:MAG: carbohydrate-binding domain-containing protein, partial [Lachnospiraceae bacterium]|nr:carbohydrate-binding domain-containing protein [Lachnospiraceae bacterium]
MKKNNSGIFLACILSAGLLAGTVYNAYYGGEAQAASASAYMVSDAALANETAVITLAQDASSVSGNGAVVTGNTITITKAGVYRLIGTLTEGQIVVNTGSKKSVVLVLDGVYVANESDAALYVKNSGNLAVYLTEGTENTFISGTQTQILEEAEQATDTASVSSDENTDTVSASNDENTDTVSTSDDENQDNDENEETTDALGG